MQFNPPEQVELSSFTFEDVDQFADWERQMGLDLEALQLTCGENKLEFNYFAHPELTLARFSAKRAMQNHFKLTDGIVMIVICRAPQPVLWRGRQVTRNMVTILRAPREHWVVLPDDWDCTELFVSEEMIRRTELFPPGFFDDTEDPQKACIPLSDSQLAQFLQITDSCFLHSSIESIWFIDQMMHALQQTIDAAVPTSGSAALRTSRRPELVARGREFVTANLQSDFTAEEMADALNVSYRVLNYAFKDTVGISPYRYIQAERLHAVKRLLQKSAVTVTEACFKYGFYSPGRFTYQYTRLFGERPTDTIRRDRLGLK